jgi:protein-S-isoprenylcysteine O-methyltransferase Ste14
MSALSGAGAVIFKWRGLLWGIFGLCVLALPVDFSAPRMLFAAPLLALGQLLRFWAAGVIPKYRTLTVGAPRLVTKGPYALVRNPLYAGNALMGSGWSLMAGWWWVIAFTAVFFVIYSLVIIPYEETFLMGKFRDEYATYKSTTPALIPNFRCIWKVFGKTAGYARFDRAGSWSMERHSLFMNIIVTVLVCLKLFTSII